MMKKTNSSLCIGYFVMATAFVVLMLVIPFPKTASVWIMFGVTVASMLVGMYIALYAFGGDKPLMSKFYGYPIWRISAMHIALQTLATIVICTAGVWFSIAYWISIVICVLLAAPTVIGLVVADSKRDYIEELATLETDKTKAIGDFQIDVESLIDSCKNDNVMPSLARLAQKVKYSDPVSNDATLSIEDTIRNELCALKTMLADGDTGGIIDKIEAIINLISTRNRLCERNK